MSIERPLENSVQNVTVTDQMIKRYDPMVLISPLRFRGFSLLVQRIPGDRRGSYFPRNFLNSKAAWAILSNVTFEREVRFSLLICPQHYKIRSVNWVFPKLTAIKTICLENLGQTTAQKCKKVHFRLTYVQARGKTFQSSLVATIDINELTRSALLLEQLGWIHLFNFL